MILKIGEGDYPCERDFQEAVILGRKHGRNLPIVKVTLADMRDQRARHSIDGQCILRGFPTSIAFDAKEKKALLFPNPDGEYVLELRVPEEAAPAREVLHAKK